jgi:predicted secreted hydrolase
MTIASAGIPALADPAADLAAHTPGPEANWNDSIYIAGRVHCGDHRFGILVHTLAAPNLKVALLTFSVTDETTGRYMEYSAPAPDGSYHWDYSASGLDIRLPGLTWTCGADRMHVSATTPWGSPDVNLVVQGPVMKYADTGHYPPLGKPSYKYAFPSMRTTGTLTIEGNSYEVSGDSRLDRQWGPLPSLTRVDRRRAAA